MRPNVSSIGVILGTFSLAQAAAYNRRQAATSSLNLAEGFMSMFNRVGGAQTVTETIRQTITVGGAGGFGPGTNATGAVTVTVTAAASTVTVFPGQANGAVEGGQGGASTSAAAGGAAGSVVAPPAAIASGGVGVTTIPVPTEARKTTLVGNQPVATPPAAKEPAAAQPTASSGNAGAGSSSTQLPTQGGNTQPGLVQPPALSTSTSVSSVSATSSASSLSATSSVQTPPTPTSPTSVPIVGAPASETAAPASGSTLAPLPGLASSLSNTLSLPGTGNAAVPTVLPNAGGAFGGSVGLIPMESASVATPSPTTPGVANGAGVAPTLNVSGLTLSSQLKLGNLAKQTTTPSA